MLLHQRFPGLWREVFWRSLKLANIQVAVRFIPRFASREIAPHNRCVSIIMIHIIATATAVCALADILPQKCAAAAPVRRRRQALVAAFGLCYTSPTRRRSIT